MTDESRFRPPAVQGALGRVRLLDERWYFYDAPRQEYLLDVDSSNATSWKPIGVVIVKADRVCQACGSITKYCDICKVLHPDEEGKWGFSRHWVELEEGKCVQLCDDHVEPYSLWTGMNQIIDRFPAAMVQRIEDASAVTPGFDGPTELGAYCPNTECEECDPWH